MSAFLAADMVTRLSEEGEAIPPEVVPNHLLEGFGPDVQRTQGMHVFQEAERMLACGNLDVAQRTVDKRIIGSALQAECLDALDLQIAITYPNNLSRPLFKNLKPRTEELSDLQAIDNAELRANHLGEYATVMSMPELELNIYCYLHAFLVESVPKELSLMSVSDVLRAHDDVVASTGNTPGAVAEAMTEAVGALTFRTVERVHTLATWGL